MYKKKNKTVSSPIMRHRYAKRAMGDKCVLPPAGARRYEANHRGIEGSKNTGHNVHV